jgi:cysteine synthase A
MTIISTADELFGGDVCIDLGQTLGIPLHLSCEGFNFAGSIKIRAAVSMVSAGIQQGLITQDSTLVESSSGNLGVALSVVAAARSLRFVCVTDPKCNPATVKLMRALGARVVLAEVPDGSGSYLSARKELVRELCRRNPGYVWLNQYENPVNWTAHYDITAPLIAKQFPGLDALFVGTGTGGTLTGCSRYFRENGARVRIVAVDTVGSVNFGRPVGPRHLPGVGASEPMPLLGGAAVDDLVQVPEPETVRMCRRLARHGFLLGASTGTVVSGAARWLAEHDPEGRLTAVAVSADTGERYLDTVYDDSWVRRTYGRPEGGTR